MAGNAPETAEVISFGDDELNSYDWVCEAFDSGDQTSERMPVASIGTILVKIRSKMDMDGISQEEMAALLGVPKRTYAAYETHEIRKVPAEVLRRVAEVTDVDADFILTGRIRNHDPGPVIDEALRLFGELMNKELADGERLSATDAMNVVYAVLSAREARRRETDDPTAEYDQTDIAKAILERTEYSYRFRRAQYEAGNG